MNDVMDFLSAALPWICMGLLLAIFFAQSSRRKKNTKVKETYSSEGIALGMCFGTAIGTALGSNTGIGMMLGMLAGYAIGLSVVKKDEEE